MYSVYKKKNIKYPQHIILICNIIIQKSLIKLCRMIQITNFMLNIHILNLLFIKFSMKNNNLLAMLNL